MKFEVAVPWLLSLVTIGIGIWQYADKTGQANKEPFLKKQLEFCFEASDTAAKLATERDPTIWLKHEQRFWELYWGNLSMVENRAVEAAMVEFGRVLRQLPTEPALPAAALTQPSLKLAHAARDLILESWQIDLEPLQGQKDGTPGS